MKDEEIAEEWVEKEYDELRYEKCERKDFVFTFYELKEMGKQAFLAGLNKANEWHYVKDGDLPKETGLLMSETLNLITRMKGTDNYNLALGQFNFSTQEFSYQHMIGLTEVYAWKEIILPKLPKESE